MKTKAPKATFVLHKTGRVIMLGKFKNDRRLKYAILKLEKMLIKINIKCLIKNIAIKNIVFNGKKFKFKICPYELKKIFNESLFYEPELFPAMHYFHPNTKICVTIHLNGVTSIKVAQNVINSILIHVKNKIVNDVSLQGRVQSNDLIT
ncbi:TATA binding protein of transcription factor IID-like protein [Leptotrombidium deliense]|uniref:TATA binding protein of transcription factor IID-like protein n=1 Tax=Leptotrombidium deliense TaxID=299467 RepID=A0A443RZG4_9ACAR|nr:TATA binding protein of transcription factor IID-like protein [Leptotrombidium deliense]